MISLGLFCLAFKTKGGWGVANKEEIHQGNVLVGIN